MQWGSMSQGSAFYLSSAWMLKSGNLLFDFFSRCLMMKMQTLT